MAHDPRTHRLLPIALGLAALLSGCASAGLTAAARPAQPAPERDPWPPSGQVNGAQARELVARGALLVDVRTEEAFTVEKLPGALSLPIEELDQAKELFEKARPLVLYCGAGIQSAAAAKHLAAMGFTHVYDLGPMFGWRR